MTCICIGGTFANETTPKTKAAARNAHWFEATNPITIKETIIAADHTINDRLRFALADFPPTELPSTKPAPTNTRIHGKTERSKPPTPTELVDHDCLAMVRAAEPLTTWHFQTIAGTQSVTIRPARSTNDGALIRRWAFESAGIALKSFWDVANDLKDGSLVTLLDDYTQDFERQGTSGGADLHVVYPAREFLPLRTRGFIEALVGYFSNDL